MTLGPVGTLAHAVMVSTLATRTRRLLIFTRLSLASAAFCPPADLSRSAAQAAVPARLAPKPTGTGR
jgi:hypothetical protein